MSAALVLQWTVVAHALIPPQAVVDFDRDTLGNPIADDLMVNNLYTPWGVALSSSGTAADGNVYARNYTASATPDTPPNVQSLFKAPLATDINDNLGRIRATFQPPARQVIVAVIPINEIGHPYLRAYNAAGGLIAEDSRSSTPGAAHLWLRVSAQTDSIAWVEYSSYSPQGAPTHVIFDTLIVRRAPVEVLPDPIWVDDDNHSGTEDGSHEHPFDTIAEAMALAITHTIQVRPGTYRESVLMRDGVKLLGSGPLGTILDGNSPGVSCTGVGPDTVVAGFTITGASQGIVCQSASPTIRDNIIFNIAPGNLGGDGIRLTDSSPNIHNNVIYHVGGMGISGRGNSEPRIVNNTIYDYGYYAGISFAALNIGSVSPTIFNNIIMRGNSAPVGGILWKLPASPILGYNDVFDPANVTGGGSFHAFHDGITWQEASGGPGAISENPQFVDELHGDFHLRLTSPCVNAGHPDAEYLDEDGSRNDIGAYGGHPTDPGGSGFLGSGFIFTSVGKIPTTEIVQDPLSLTLGLAVVSPTASSDFQIPQYLDSPFGGSLWIRGLFGVADSVDYYQLFAWPEGATTPISLNDPLSKVRYTILPGGSVVSTTIHLGPQTVGGVPNLYQLNKEGYWSHEDLRMVWNTAGLNGRFTLTCQPYIRIATDTVAQVLLPSVSGDHLTLWVDSSPLVVRINDILFADHTPIAECEEIALPHGASNELIFNITAFHPGGFLNSYSLDCAWGHNHYGGNFTSDRYAGVHSFPPPLWVGVWNLELPALLPRDGMGNPVPWEDCAYGFTLSAGSRVTDGFQYLQATSFTSMHAVENLLNKDGGETPAGPCANCPTPADPAGGDLLSLPETIPTTEAPLADKGPRVKAPPGDTVWVDDDNVSGTEDGTELHPYNTIGEGILAANPGTQVVRVLPGHYGERVIMRDQVSVIGSGADSTTIDPATPTTAVSCTGIGADTLLVGFRIANAGTGVYCLNSSLQIRENVITNMNYASLAADGIRLDDSSPIIANNVIHHVGGMGIRGQGNSSPAIVNNTLLDYGYYAGISFAALNIGAVTPTIKNNIVARGNSAPVGGVLWRVPAAPVVDYNDVFDPANVTGGGSYNAVHDGIAWHEVHGLVGAISDEPNFVDPAHGNLRLNPSSPCIDAGDPSPVYNDTDGSRNDMGAYGGQRMDSGESSHPGSGFLFTSIGNVPITEIVADPLDPSHGLLKVSEAAAQDFHIPQYTDSPLGGTLWLHGLFGAMDGVDYYQILAATYGTSATTTLNAPLTKYRFTINPDGTLTWTRHQMGPLSIGGVDNLYMLNKTGYWTFTDLRYIWNTSELSGKYSVSYRAFRDMGGGVVMEVPLPRNDLDHFTILINNTPPQMVIEDVAYSDHLSIAECEKITLPHGGDDRLIFTLTAWHPEGFLRYFLLNCWWGNHHYGGRFVYDQYVGSHDGAPPTWQGVVNHQLDPLRPVNEMGDPSPWQNCAYRFHLEGSTRATDGITYLYWSGDELFQSVVSTGPADTPTPTETETPTATATEGDTPTVTATGTNSPTLVATPTATDTSAPTPTSTLVATPTATPVPGDTNGDGMTNKDDLFYFVQDWKLPSEEADPNCNPSGDDRIDHHDLLLLIQLWLGR